MQGEEEGHAVNREGEGGEETDGKKAMLGAEAGHAVSSEGKGGEADSGEVAEGEGERHAVKREGEEGNGAVGSEGGEAAEGEEEACRYCFEGADAGELISPCQCAGGQKFVHLSCLRRWQRMVLVSQPTHPAFYERDPRHYRCNVCNGPFSCPPPTRLELVASFTGPELGALIEPSCLIAAHESFTRELQRQLDDLPEVLVESSSYAHWCNGVYLITKVEPLEPTVSFTLHSASQLERLRSRLDSSLTITNGGQTLRLLRAGSLANVAEEELAAALEQYHEGMQLVLERVPRPGFGDDHVTAVNLSRPLRRLPSASAVAASVARAKAKFPATANVELTHYNGGPCDGSAISCCLVVGGTGRGWSVVYGDDPLCAALECAHARSLVRSEAQGEVRGGQTVRLAGLRARPELNGERGIALRFLDEEGRWAVRLADGEAKKLKPQNLVPLEGADGRVFCFWGDAQWSRTQLLGEIARGHWGLCRASVAEITTPPDQRRRGLEGRLVFAPDTEMMEDFIRDGARQMELERCE
ncbi:hypothetical protein AB1Y20_003477 [Prymnesium parvum]|uniref:RING-CH-type domain-containing protein n=1 Tax=Prymnesium parvum TaxID=97485 RepID=A0AB34JE84_PRYPA